MMSGQTPLGELCRLITDGKHGDCENQPDSGFYFLSAKDVRDGKLNYEDARQITETDFLDTHRRTQLEPDDLVISNSGTIGRMALVKNQPETSRTTFQKSVAILKPKHERVLASWLYYFLHFDLERLIGFAGGTAQKNLLLRDLRAFSITLQPLPTQRKIAGILAAYDNLIENNTRRIAILEEMAQAIYREWFVNFCFPGYESVKLINSPLGNIPEGWKVGVINDVIRLLSGFAFKSETFVDDGEYRLVTIKNVHDGRFVEESDSLLEVLPDKMPEYCHLSSGDILLSLTGNIGRTCIVYGSGFLLNQRVAKLSPLNAADKGYVYCLFRSPDTQLRLSNIANGVAQQNLSPVQTGQLPHVLPPRPLLDVFADNLTPLFWNIVQLYRKNSILRKTRDLLLPKLIGGQLDVEDLDIDTEESGK